MKHRVAGKKLNRSSNHRRALYKNLLSALIINGSIKTTKAKSKGLKSQFDKLMTKAIKGTVNHRRQIDQVLNNTKLVNKLVDDLAKNLKRSSGFTRTVNLGTRRGDNAMLVKVEVIQDVKKDQKSAIESKKESKPKNKSTKEIKA